jgi:predicted permease
MNIFLIAFEAVAALLGIGILGFWVIGRRRVPTNVLVILNSLAIDIALPCLVLGNMLTDFSPQKFPDWWHMPLWWSGFTVLAVVLSIAASFLVKRSFRGEFAMSLAFQNGAFFPILIITGLFGSSSNLLVYLFLFIFLQPSLIFGTYPLFFRKNSPDNRLNLRRIINPVLIMTLAGLLAGLAGITDYIPDFLVMIVTLIGAMAIPLFMLILGGSVYNDYLGKDVSERRIFTREVVLFTLVKNLVFPLVFLGLLIWLNPDYTIALILILEAAVPPITAIPIFAERSGGNRAITNQFIVASFIFSVISIPAVMYLFGRFFLSPARAISQYQVQIDIMNPLDIPVQ